MKMLKADFFKLVNDLQSAGATGFAIRQYPGLMMTELQYLTRLGKLTYVKICDSSTPEGRSAQATTYRKWLEQAVAQWDGVVMSMAPMSPADAIARAQNIVANLLSMFKSCHYMETIHASTVAALFATLANDIQEQCADKNAAAELVALLTNGRLQELKGSCLNYVDISRIIRAFLADSEAAFNALIIRQQSTLEPLTAYVMVMEFVMKQFTHFTDEANAKFNAAFDTIINGCSNEAYRTWLGCNMTRSYMTHLTTAEVLQPEIKRFKAIIDAGHLPTVPDLLTESQLWSMDWWEPKEITLTSTNGNGVYLGTAQVTDVEGLYKLSLVWKMETGDTAEKEGLPAIFSIVDAQLVIPAHVLMVDRKGKPADVLAAVQELDAIQGFCAHFFNACYPGVFSDREERAF